MTYTHENFAPLGEQVILQPGPLKYLIQTLQVQDEKKNKGKGAEDVKETKELKQKIKTIYRVGKVLVMGSNLKNAGFEVGDWVVYNQYEAKPFDLLAKKAEDEKCPVIIKSWSLLSKVDHNKLN